MQYGRQPETRLRIEQLLAEYYRGGATAEIKTAFTDWGIMVQATLAQATRFEIIHEARPEEDRAIVDMWFRVMRVRSQQNSLDAKIAKKLRALTPYAEPAAAQPEEGGEPQ